MRNIAKRKFRYWFQDRKSITPSQSEHILGALVTEGKDKGKWLGFLRFKVTAKSNEDFKGGVSLVVTIDQEIVTPRNNEHTIKVGDEYHVGPFPAKVTPIETMPKEFADAFALWKRRVTK